MGSHTINFSTMDGWTTPASQTVSIVANQTDAVTATYVAIPQTGALEVNLSPAVAQWSVDSGVWQNSGAVVSGLSVGSHTVTFSAMSGWTTPASQSVSVVANQTNSIAATYVAIPQTGSLQVTLNVPGAQWSVDNGLIQNSGAIVSGLSVGTHTINFSTMNGWTTPASQTVSIVANQTDAVTATYVAIPQTGALEVTLSPVVAQWSVDSGAWQNSGAVVAGLSVGSHTVTFSAMSGWTTPAAQTVSVVANQTNSISAAYVVIPQTGSLHVTLNVPGAQWSVDNGLLQNSGAFVSGLSVGSHTISFSAMTGWTTPASQTVLIVANQTDAVTATYVAIPQTGAMQVNLSPAVAQWAVDGGIWQNSGAVVAGLSVGSHTVTFSAMSGWTTPASQSIAIAVNQTNAISAIYVAVPQTGALEVTLNPAIAQWCVDNGSWQNSAAVVSGLSVGSHTISFAPMDGWTTPVSQTVSIVANQTNSVAANYLAVATVGAVQVNLTPVNAQWSVDNGVWQNSGATVAGLAGGSHTISFSALSGWTRPFNQTVTIAANQTSSIAAAYVAIPQTGALQVNLSLASAQWCVDNGSWQNSGATVSRLSVGSHTIAFSSLTGWTTPAPMTVMIAANQTMVVPATYKSAQQAGALEVTLNLYGAQWSVDGGYWRDSGKVASGLTVGSHTLTFSTMTNWLTPSNQLITIVANQTNSFTATYIPAPVPTTGSLQVTLNPAVTQWAIDGGLWQNSGVVISNVLPGSHMVTFSPLNGWIAPSKQTVVIVAGQD